MTEDKTDQKPEETKAPVEPIVNADPQLNEFVTKMPEVVDDAVQAASEKNNDALKLQSEAKDAKGRAFNANFHMIDPVSGVPLMTPSGRFKSKSRITAHFSPNGKVQIPETEPAQDQRIKVAAQKFADIFIITGISFFGEEWKPEKSQGVDERQMLVDANERWMIENGYVEPPAWIDLMMAYGLYSGKRFFQPVTKSKVKILWEKVKFASLNLWFKIQGKDFKVAPSDKK